MYVFHVIHVCFNLSYLNIFSYVTSLFIVGFGRLRSYFCILFIYFMLFIVGEFRLRRCSCSHVTYIFKYNIFI